ncbi:MAG: hypothetical protein KME21_29470 [Desmonostoc vinosum HA7617-LM4]|nr:hypothetical protein [Desmonostoc vinosum HA7617-LM4]
MSEDTNGQYTLAELRVDPEIGPPPHIHHREDEAFYIQEGELEFQHQPTRQDVGLVYACGN